MVTATVVTATVVTAAVGASAVGAVAGGAVRAAAVGARPISGAAPGALALAALAACTVAAIARRMGALTGDGAVAAAIVGFIVFGWGGVAAALSLLVFFVSGSVLTRWTERRERHDAQGRRAAQVLANGAVAATAVVVAALEQGPMGAAAFVGAIATSTADTWATEFGAASRKPPVLITTGQRVPTGQSGAISIVGTLGGVAGALLIGVVGAGSMILFPRPMVYAALMPPANAVPLVIAAVVGGVTGMIGDSLLGATVQEYFYCPECGARTERPVHRCQAAGVRTERAGGWPGFNNDTVNLAATVIGATTAMAVYRLLAAVIQN